MLTCSTWHFSAVMPVKLHLPFGSALNFRRCALYAEVPCSTEIMVMAGEFWKQNFSELFLFHLFICWAKQVSRQLVSTREICIKRGLHKDRAAPFTPKLVTVYLTFQLSRFFVLAYVILVVYTDNGQRSFSFQAPLSWNQLPISVRHSTSVSSFKSFKPFSS